jgi:hypothetical protein
MSTFTPPYSSAMKRANVMGKGVTLYHGLNLSLTHKCSFHILRPTKMGSYQFTKLLSGLSQERIP